MYSSKDMKTKAFVAALLIVGLLVLCGGSPASGSTTETGKPAYGGVIKVAMSAVAPNVDGHSNVTTAGGHIARHLFETLVAWGENFTPTPELAESWTLSTDGLTYTFKLRKGVKFHNGKEMTSADVIASMDRYLQVTSRAASFAILKSYKATDSYTVVMNLSQPTAIWLDTLAHMASALYILPKEIMEKKGKELLTTSELIGTGPYKMTEYVPDRMIRLTRFADYKPLSGNRNGLGGAKIAYFDEIQFIPVTETGTRVAGLETAEYDVIEAVPGSEVARIQKDKNLQVAIKKPVYGTCLIFNHGNSFSKDVNFRQAVLAVLDMDALGMAATNGNKDLYDLDASLWPSTSAWYYVDDFAKSQYNQKNPDKAKQLLKQAKYNGEEIVLLGTPDYGEDFLALQSVADQLRKIGVNAKVISMDWPSMLAKFKETTGWNISISGFSSPNIYLPNNWSMFWSSKGTAAQRAFFSSQTFDAVFAKLDAALRFEDRKAALREVQTTYYKELPYIQIYQFYTANAARANIKNLSPFPGINLWGVWSAK